MPIQRDGKTYYTLADLESRPVADAEKNQGAPSHLQPYPKGFPTQAALAAAIQGGAFGTSAPNGNRDDTTRGALYQRSPLTSASSTVSLPADVVCSPDLAKSWNELAKGDLSKVAPLLLRWRFRERFGRYATEGLAAGTLSAAEETAVRQLCEGKEVEALSARSWDDLDRSEGLARLKALSTDAYKNKFKERFGKMPK